MSKFLVETHYNCTFKITHELDELNEKALSEVDSRKDGKVEIVNVTVNNRKTKRSDGKKTVKSDLENIEISHKKESLNTEKLKNELGAIKLSAEENKDSYEKILDKTTESIEKFIENVEASYKENIQ